MFRKLLCHAQITVTLECVDPILIKSGYATVDGPDSVPVSSYRGGEKPTYFLPGSSLKGVFRSHSERIIRTLKPKMTCVPYEGKKDDEVNDLYISCGKRLRTLKEKMESSTSHIKRSFTASDAYRLQCPVCRTFGSTMFAGKISFADALPIEGTEPLVDFRDGIGIDRFTGGAAHGAKFEYTAIVSGKFETTITIKNFELWQLGLLQIVIEDMNRGIIRIGSGKSRGMGRVKVEVTEYKVIYPFPQKNLVGIERLANDRDIRKYGLFAADNVSISLPAPIVVGLQHIYNLTDQQEQIVHPLIECFGKFIESGYEVDWLSAINAALKEG